MIKTDRKYTRSIDQYVTPVTPISKHSGLSDGTKEKNANSGHNFQSCLDKEMNKAR